HCWDVIDGKFIWSFGTTDKQDPNPLCSAFSPDGKLVATRDSRDGQPRFLDAATGAERTETNGHHGFIVDLAYAPDGRTVATLGMDQTIRVWDVAMGKELRRIAFEKRPSGPLAVSPDGRTAAIGLEDLTVRLLDLVAGKETAELEKHYGVPFSLVF